MVRDVFVDKMTSDLPLKCQICQPNKGTDAIKPKYRLQSGEGTWVSRGGIDSYILVGCVGDIQVN